MVGIAVRHFSRLLHPRLSARQLSSIQAQRNQNLHNDQHPNIIRSHVPDLVLPNISLHEYLFDRIAKFGKKTAVQCSTTGRSYTFDDIQGKSRNLGRALRKKLKLQRNDVVCVLLPNVPEFPICILGTLAGGGILTTMNPIYTAEEINRQLKDSGAKVIITLSELYPVVKAAIGTSLPVITINHKPDTQTPQGTISFTELTDSNIDLPDIHDYKPDDIALMPYSSGTTGLPKGVCLSHRNLLANLFQTSIPEFNILNEIEGDKQDIVPAVLPLFHIYGFTCITGSAMHVGAKIITMSQFAPELYAKMLVEHKPNVLFLVPPIVIFLYAHPMITKQHLESVRTILSGAAPLGALDIAKFREKADKEIMVSQGYGLSESSPAVFLTPADNSSPSGSTGRLLPNITAKLLPVDEPHGEPLGPNQLGECYIKGDNVMMGYHNRPKETEETLIDGWLRTGDLFYYDENKNFFVADRIKELIKVKGFQVPPAELEEVLRDHPDLADAAVIGIPHKFSGEVPRAYIVPKPNKTVDIDALHEYVNKKVAEYKRLEGGIEVIAAIPKNPSGKILRRQLKLNYLKQNK